MKPTKKVVIVGGGTGTYAVTQTVRTIGADITKIVTMFDSGGSTRRLMDEFGFLPVGDLRQNLAALAHENGQSWIRDLLLYRFSKGKGLEGHNLGNLILTALQDMTGSTPKALEVASKIFRLEGTVLPVSEQYANLRVVYRDGSAITGEHKLDDAKRGGREIKKVTLTKRCHVYKKSKQAIEEADYIIIGPGDLYASIVPNFLVSGVKAAFSRTNAKLIYITNLMTRYTQTHNFTAQDHLNEIEKYLDKTVDIVLVNSGEIEPGMKKRYAKYKEFPVENNLEQRPGLEIIHQDFASSLQIKKKKGDKTPRAFMRHDATKLQKVLAKVLK